MTLDSLSHEPPSKGATKKLGWFKSTYGKLQLGATLIGAAMLIVVVFSQLAFNFVRSEVAATSHLGKGRSEYEMLYLAQVLPQATGAAREDVMLRLRSLIAQTDRLVNVQVEGDAKLGISATSNSAIRSELENTREYWLTVVRPMLEQSLSSSNGSGVDLNLAPIIESFTDRMGANIDLVQLEAAANVERARMLQIALFAVAICMLGLVLWQVRVISKRSAELVATADRIAEGDIDTRAPEDGEDELAQLGSSLNAMTDKLKGYYETERLGRRKLENVLETITETADSLSAAATEIMEGMTAQASGMREQSAAVSQTVTSLHDVVATADQATQRATSVAESSVKAEQVSKAGRAAVDETKSAMAEVKEKSEDISANIIALAERSVSIREIVTVMKDIADQTNLLAINAAIEASRAGEHGQAFNVIAEEIRSLSVKTKDGTEQVKRILAESQKSTDGAVIATEEGIASINTAIDLVEQAGETIRELDRIISDSSRQAAQISASAEQQTTGMMQIKDAMNHIDSTSSQNLITTRQTEVTAKHLGELGMKLKQLVTGQAA